MSNKINELENEIDKQEQYSRHNCILIHGIPENVYEVTDECVIKTIAEHRVVKISVEDINRSDRLGKPRKNKD